MKKPVFKNFSITVLSFWLSCFALLPCLFILLVSFLSISDTQLILWKFSFSNYLAFFHSLYLKIFWHSLELSLLTALLCLVIAYPFAYVLAILPQNLRFLGLCILMIPFWTSSLIRTYALMTLIKSNGLINQCLLALGWLQHPFHLLYTPIAVEIGLIYTLLPFMALPIFANLEKFDWRLLEAASDLGASKIRQFLQIVLPLSLPGMMGGMTLVFLPAMTLFYIPDILGGAKSILMGNVIKNQFTDMHNWPMGAALSVILTLTMLILFALYASRSNTKSKPDRGLA